MDLDLSLGIGNHQHQPRNLNFDLDLNLNPGTDNHQLQQSNLKLNLDLGIGNHQDQFRINQVIPELEVIPDQEQEKWTIKKILTRSDCNSSSRLLLAHGLVQEHILPNAFCGAETWLNNGNGITFDVHDVQIHVVVQLTLKQWKTGSFVFMGGWSENFVRRRGLNEGDEIGLRWNQGRLEFAVVAKNQ